MFRSAVVLLLVAGCTSPAPSASTAISTTALDSLAVPAAPTFTRQHIVDDIYHYQLDVRVGSTANAIVRVHRVVRVANGVPRPSSHAVMLLHGDFANFVTNFAPTLGTPASSAPGLAPYLAARNLDVWGVDRRWTLPGSDGDLSDLGGMSVAQELGDIETALALARATRTITDKDGGPLTLAGFSHGGELAYAYAAGNGRHIDALAILDVYYDLAPADADAQAFACANASAEQAALAAGTVDSDNSFFVAAGQLDRSAPNDPSPIFPPYSNQGALFTFVGTTYQFAPYTPLYHLAAPILDSDGNVTALRESTEDAVSAWFAGAPPHQSEHEAADLDAIWCGGSTGRAPLANIRVPLIYIGAAGAFGAHGLYSTTRVSSTDVTTLVVHRFGAARVAEDFGHGDLLYATDAPALAWHPLASWLAAH